VALYSRTFASVFFAFACTNVIREASLPAASPPVTAASGGGLSLVPPPSVLLLPSSDVASVCDAGVPPLENPSDGKQSANANTNASGKPAAMVTVVAAMTPTRFTGSIVAGSSLHAHLALPVHLRAHYRH